MATTLAAERFWADKSRFNNAERQYYESLTKEMVKAGTIDTNDLLNGSASATSQKLAQKPKYKKVKKSKSLKDDKEDMNQAVSSSVQPEVNIESSCQPPDVAVEVKLSGKKNKKKSKASLKKTEQSPDECQSYSSQKIQIKPTLKLGNASSQCTLVSEIAKAREHIKNSLEKMDGIATLAASPVSTEVLDRISAIEKENADLKKLVESLRTLCLQSQQRINALESQLGKPTQSAATTTVAAASTIKKSEPEDDDGVDLFASDSEEEGVEAARIREERLAAYAAKKSTKPVLIAKSSLVLDVKPWDDETDLKIMETEIRKIVCDGLLWGASKFVPVAFGIQKLSISCVVEDEKVSIDWLTEEIEKLEDYVQSVDVAAFNKI